MLGRHRNDILWQRARLGVGTRIGNRWAYSEKDVKAIRLYLRQ